MLSLQTVQPDTLELMRTLMRLPILSDRRIVGGTALALQYGHRRSVDLDFFGHTTEDTDELTETIREGIGQVQILSVSKRIKVYNIRNVKVDIVNYDYPWIDDVVAEEGLEYLDAPILRYGAPFTPIPFTPALEKLYRVYPEDLVKGIKGVL